MQIDRRDMAHIAGHRLLTENLLSALLIRAGSPTTLKQIRKQIFDQDHTRLSAYFAKMLRLFELTDIDIDTVVPILQDAWNYFPHRSLNGQSPAERLLALREIEARDLVLLDGDDQRPSDEPFEDDARLI